jgi:hypothetical protein
MTPLVTVLMRKRRSSGCRVLEEHGYGVVPVNGEILSITEITVTGTGGPGKGARLR